MKVFHRAKVEFFSEQQINSKTKPVATFSAGQKNGSIGQLSAAPLLYAAPGSFRCGLQQTASLRPISFPNAVIRHRTRTPLAWKHFSRP